MKMTAGRIMKAQVLLGVLLVALLGVAGGEAVSEQGNPLVWVSLGKVKVKAEAVSTPEKLYQGLSSRRELAEGRGMLFFMPEIAVQTFCMRGMRFPLDLVWIVDGRVAGITRNVPSTFPGELPSPTPVNYVLEVPGGFADRYGIKAGDWVKVKSIRGEVRARADVTRRVAPFSCGKAGQQNTVEMVALPWHFGFAGLITGGPDSQQNYAANQLVPMVGDANTMIPEYKVFLVDVQKV